ncbi:MAG: hypothetical protein WC372_11460 [Candidatus Neomarinimicrobiota bacterium]|jgi:hypothetical protein
MLLKITQVVLSLFIFSWSSGDMDYPVKIPTVKDTLTVGASLVVEGRGYAYHDFQDYVYLDGAQHELKVHSDWDTRQGVKLEVHSNTVSLRAAYFDDRLGNMVERVKNGTNREDFVRKEDFAKLLELSLGVECFEFYFIRDFSRFGTYQMDEGEAQPFTFSKMSLGVKAWQKTKLGAIGGYLEGTRFRTLRLLRISSINDKGNTQVIRTFGPMNETENGIMGGFFRSPDPSGKMYLTYTAAAGIGVAGSPVDQVTDIGMPGYYLYQEGYDILCNLDGAILFGFNFELGSVKLRLSSEIFAHVQFATPASNVYPVGVDPDHIPRGETIDDYDDDFSEEYSLADIVYGASAQIKILF